MTQTDPEVRQRRRALLMTVPALAVLALVLLLPLGIVVLRSFTVPEPGLGNYVWFFGTKVNLTVLLRTFTIAFWVTLVCVVAAFVLAYAIVALRAGNPPAILPVVGQVTPTLLLYPLAHWLIERFDDGDTRFR